MERNDSVANRLTLAPSAASHRAVAKTRRNFALRCLKAIAATYVQSSAYSPYWIGARPLPEPHRSGAQG